MEGEEIGTLGLRGLRLTLRLCYANFLVYLLLYVTGMYINIFITSGVNTIGIGDVSNIIHMVLAIVNFAFTFVVMVVGFLYGMKKVGLFSLGAVVSLVTATAGGMLFITSGGGRRSDICHTDRGMDNVISLHARFVSFILCHFEVSCELYESLNLSKQTE